MPVATATATATAGPIQLDDGNPNGWNTTAGTPGAFFGNTPVAQPSGAQQRLMLAGAPAGVVTGWSSYQTAFASAGVANITSTEFALTVQQGVTTSMRLVLGTADVVYLNKPSSQAGLGVGNVRVSVANVIGVTLNNDTAATITPSVTEIYRIASTKSLPTISKTLSPTAVKPNTTAEFVVNFTATDYGTGPGVSVGQLLQVMKPTSQAGLDVVGCRVIANNQVGITFANVTAASITPTASESYTFQALSALDAHNNFMTFTINGGAVGSLSGGEGVTATGGNTSFAGVLASDLAVGAPLAPTAANNGQAATNAAWPVYSLMTANNITMYFGTIGTGATPTANTYWDQLVFRFNPAAPLVLYSQSLAPVSVAANTTAEQTFTVTGLLANTVAWVNKPSFQAGLGIAGVRVSAASTLAINYLNTTANAITPATEVYTIGNFQAQAPTPTTSNTTGGAVSQQCVQSLMSTINQVAAARAANVALGLWAGA